MWKLTFQYEHITVLWLICQYCNTMHVKLMTFFCRGNSIEGVLAQLPHLCKLLSSNGYPDQL